MSNNRGHSQWRLLFDRNTDLDNSLQNSEDTDYAIRQDKDAYYK
ncbi:hypothetical protein [Xenorhabdus sp. BG5]